MTRFKSRPFTFSLALICTCSLALPLAAAADTPQITSTIAYARGFATKAGEQTYLIEVLGTSLYKPGDTVTIAPLPAPDGETVFKFGDDTEVIGQFTAGAGYTLHGVAVYIQHQNVPQYSTLSYEVPSPGCDMQHQVTVRPQTITESDAGDNFGDGVSKNFYVVQLAMTNGCSVPVGIQLSSICFALDDRGCRRIAMTTPDPQSLDSSSKTDAAHSAQDAARSAEAASASAAAAAANPEGCPGHDLVPLSLAHVTSLYTADRLLTGKRALYFNGLQSFVTLGSSLGRFLGSGFTQAISILGGGFTSASKQMLVDMSAAQLQNLASQSFGSVEQVAPGGSLLKLVYVPRAHNCKETDKLFMAGAYTLYWQGNVTSEPQQVTTKAAPAAKPPTTL